MSVFSVVLGVAVVLTAVRIGSALLPEGSTFRFVNDVGLLLAWGAGGGILLVGLWRKSTQTHGASPVLIQLAIAWLLGLALLVLAPAAFRAWRRRKEQASDAEGTRSDFL